MGALDERPSAESSVFHSTPRLRIFLRGCLSTLAFGVWVWIMDKHEVDFWPFRTLALFLMVSPVALFVLALRRSRTWFSMEETLFWYAVKNKLRSRGAASPIKTQSLSSKMFSDGNALTSKLSVAVRKLLWASTASLARDFPFRRSPRLCETASRRCAAANQP
jgi:hypothetical protein